MNYFCKVSHSTTYASNLMVISELFSATAKPPPYRMVEMQLKVQHVRVMLATRPLGIQVRVHPCQQDSRSFATWW